MTPIKKKPKKKKKVKKKVFYKTWRAREGHGVKLTATQEKKKYSHYVKELTYWFNTFIKLRDFDGRARIKCITCDKYITRDDANACHYITTACRLYKRDEKNINTGCAYCNCYDKQNHQQNYTLWMIRQYGIDYVEEMKFNEKQINKKPRLEEIEHLISHYKDKVKEIKTACIKQ